MRIRQRRTHRTRWQRPERFLVRFDIHDDNPDADEVVVRATPPGESVTCGRHYLTTPGEFARLVRMSFRIVIDDLPEDEAEWQKWLREHTIRK